MKLSALTVPEIIAAIAGEVSIQSNCRVGDHATKEIRGRTVRLRKLDDHLGGADTYVTYLLEVNTTARLLRDGLYSKKIRQELLSIYAEQAQQAGWAAFDAGWHDAGTRLYQRSYAAAEAAGDFSLAGNSLAFHAYQMLNMREFAVEISDLSIRKGVEGRAHPRVLALLYSRGAWTYALMGDVEVTRRMLGLAAEELAREPDEEPPDYAAWIDETELKIMGGRCWAELKRPLLSVPLLESALDNYDDGHARDKSLYLSWLADSYIDATENERAVEVINRAAHYWRLMSHPCSLSNVLKLLRTGRAGITHQPCQHQE